MDRRVLFTVAAVAVAAAVALLRPHAPDARAGDLVAVRGANGPDRPAAASQAVWSAGSAPPGAETGSLGRPGVGLAGGMPAVMPAERAPLHVYVAGEVARAGVYRLAPGERIEAAVHAAGGATAGADLVAVNLAAPLRDGEEIVVPARGSPEAAAAAAAGAGGPADASGSAELAAAGDATPAPRHRRKRHRHRKRARAPGYAGVGGAAGASASVDAAGAPATSGPLSLNDASAADLAALPGVGPALAQRIVAFRTLNGPFATLDELLDVNGMTPARLDDIAAGLRVR